MKPITRYILLGLVLLLAIILSTIFLPRNNQQQSFDGERALKDVETQMAFGPRTAGSEAHEQVITWLEKSLQDSGWQADVQQGQLMDQTIKNVIASRGNDNPRIILVAHYDSRLFADNDPDPNNQTKPVPGANDGASGVAVLLELARILPSDSVTTELVFVDAEDNGRIPGWDWILGSRYFVSTLESKPEAVVIVDMIGDGELNIYKEINSDPALTEQIWKVADNLGFSDEFINEDKYRILDDHIPFIEAGIPAVDIIDIEYPYWHTTMDTLDKVSAKSLDAVGETLLQWLLDYPPVSQ